MLKNIHIGYVVTNCEQTLELHSQTLHYTILLHNSTHAYANKSNIRIIKILEMSYEESERKLNNIFMKWKIICLFLLEKTKILNLLQEKGKYRIPKSQDEIRFLSRKSEIQTWPEQMGNI